MLPRDFWIAFTTGIVILLLLAVFVYTVAAGQTTLRQIRHCESEDNYEAVNWDDWHVWWPGYGSHWRLGSFGAYQFGWARWHSAAHSAGYHGWAHTRPDRVPAAVQDAVAAWQYRSDPTVWSCHKRILV